MNIKQALKWSFLAEFATKAIQPVVFLVLARILGPEDFGVISAALMVVAFSQIFWEGGMGKALVQRQGDIQVAANCAFWINIALSLLVAAALMLLAGPLAREVFHDERVAPVVRVMVLQIILGSMASVQTALLQKKMGFKKLFWVRFATVSLPSMTSILLAWHGMDYWALVAGTLVGQAVQVALLWRGSDWHPTLSFDVPVARELGHFGAWVSVSGLLAWFYVWADALIVGMYLGSHELGLYRTGNMVAIMIFGLIFGPVTPVLYSHLSRMKDNTGQLGATIEWTLKALTLISVPVAFVIFALAEPIEAALFGDKWHGIGRVIGAMALMHGFSWVVGMNGEFYRAMGKPSQETIVTALSLTIYLVAYLTSIRFGFDAFVFTRTSLALMALALHLIVLRQIIRIDMNVIVGLLLKTTLAAAAIVGVLRILDLPNGAGPWTALISSAILHTLLVGSSIYLLNRHGILKELLASIAARKIL